MRMEVTSDSDKVVFFFSSNCLPRSPHTLWQIRKIIALQKCHSILVLSVYILSIKCYTLNNSSKTSPIFVTIQVSVFWKCSFLHHSRSFIFVSNFFPSYLQTVWFFSHYKYINCTSFLVNIVYNYLFPDSKLRFVCLCLYVSSERPPSIRIYMILKHWVSLKSRKTDTIVWFPFIFLLLLLRMILLVT